MNYNFTASEKKFLAEIGNILKDQSNQDLYYVIGLDKQTGDRKIFLCYTMPNGEVCILAQIYNEFSNLTKYYNFEFIQDQIYKITYRKHKKWWQFWLR